MTVKTYGVPITAAVRSLLTLPVPASLWVTGVHSPETTLGLKKPEVNEHNEAENEQNLFCWSGSIEKLYFEQ